MTEEKKYIALPTIRKFHESPAQIRCIVGPVGSGKTSGATWELCYYLPRYLFAEYQIKQTRWVVVRNTYPELRDTTMRTIFDWFPWGSHKKQENIYILTYPKGFEVEILFRSCDNPNDIKKFKSLEITGYWIDESIEVNDEIKRMLKNRIGRFPQKCPARFGIETTNPPDVEHPTYHNFAWDTPPPGPITGVQPLENHVGFWQPADENNLNLRPGYYDDLRADYRDNRDWVATYIEGKPGIIVAGKMVYNNFRRAIHVADAGLIWSKGPLIRGWDHSGNCPAAVVMQLPRPRHIQILKEFHTDRMGIVDFGNYVKTECNVLYPGAQWTDWGDPAGAAEYSKKEGGFTSNSKLLLDECQIGIMSSEQNWEVRRESVERQLGVIDGVLIDPSCIRLINGFMGGYCYSEVGRTGRFADKPEKNRFSHIHEALQYAMLKIVGPMDDPRKRQTKALSEFDVHTYDRITPQQRQVLSEFDVYGRL